MIFYEFFRWVALISAIPFQLVFFKRKTYYERKLIQSQNIKRGI